MTHDDSEQHKQASDVDEHLIAKLPFGIHFDSLEGKWILVGIATAMMVVLTGSTELLAVIGPIALGMRTATPKRFPKLAALEPQPWYWIGGVMVGFPIFLAVRAALELVGVTMPDIDWMVVVDILTSLQ